MTTTSYLLRVTGGRYRPRRLPGRAGRSAGGRGSVAGAPGGGLRAGRVVRVGRVLGRGIAVRLAPLEIGVVAPAGDERTCQGEHEEWSLQIHALGTDRAATSETERTWVARSRPEPVTVPVGQEGRLRRDRPDHMPAEVGHQTKIIFVIVTTAQQPLRSVCPQERCVTTRDRLAGHRRAGAAEPEPFGRPGGQTAPETEETESRRIMATPLGRASRTSSHRPALLRRGTLALLALAGSLVVTAPAQAAPSTSAEAAQLVASRGHDLEVISERFNEARVALAAQQEAATAAAATMEQATADLAAAQQHVRGLARTAYTGEGLGSFQALLTSDSADAFVDRMAMLQLVAGHQTAILETAAPAGVPAAPGQAAAQQAASEAQAQYDAVAAQQGALQKEVDEYRSAFQQLSAQEKQAALAQHSEQRSQQHSEADRASRSEDREPAPASAPVVADGDAAQIAVDTAMAQRGKPYVWAAGGPNSFDCSGLTSYAFRAAGISLPHSSLMQSRMGQAVSRDELQPGDLVFFYSPVSHVGIYIGNGQMVHAPTSGDVVKVAPLMSGFSGARRIAA